MSTSGPSVFTTSCGVLLRAPAASALWRITCTASITSGLLVVVGVAQRRRPERFLSIFPKNGRECSERLDARSQGLLVHRLTRASPFRSGCSCTHRSGSTTCSGRWTAGQDLATKRIRNRARSAPTRRCNCSGVCCAYGGACLPGAGRILGRGLRIFVQPASSCSLAQKVML